MRVFYSSIENNILKVLKESVKKWLSTGVNAIQIKFVVGVPNNKPCYKYSIAQQLSYRLGPELQNLPLVAQIEYPEYPRVEGYV